MNTWPDKDVSKMRREIERLEAELLRARASEARLLAALKGVLALNDARSSRLCHDDSWEQARAAIAAVSTEPRNVDTSTERVRGGDES